VVHARETVAHELLRDVRDAVAAALRRLLRGEGRALADAAHHAPRAIGDASVELSALIPIECAARRIRRVLRDARQLEGFRVVERGVAAAVLHRDRMLGGHPVEIMPVERALVLQLRVVVEEPFHPRAGRRLPRLRAQLVHDALDRHEFDLERIAHEHLVEKRRAAGVVVAVREPGHDRHLLRVVRPGALPDQAANVGVRPHGDEPSALRRECLRARQRAVHRVDLGVEHDQVGVRRAGSHPIGLREARVRRGNEARTRDDSGGAGGQKTHEFPAALTITHDGSDDRVAGRA
jgi:hypothetical protein